MQQRLIQALGCEIPQPRVRRPACLRVRPQLIVPVGACVRVTRVCVLWKRIVFVLHSAWGNSVANVEGQDNLILSFCSF